MEGRKRQPERPDYSEAVEPRCPVCGEAMIVEHDEQSGRTDHLCPHGHSDEARLTDATRARPREAMGELGEDS